MQNGFLADISHRNVFFVNCLPSDNDAFFLHLRFFKVQKLIGTFGDLHPVKLPFEAFVRNYLELLGTEQRFFHDTKTGGTVVLTALQLGAGTRKPSRLTKADRGHFAKVEVEPKRKIAEFRVSPENLIDVGAEITADHFVPGQFTVLAAGLMAAYGLRLEHLDAKLIATLGLAAAADYGASVYTGGPTNTELILTTTVSNRGRFVSRKTDVYYLENVDAPLFMRSAPGYKAVNLKVVS